MTNDKLFEKRKARGKSDLLRQKAKRAPYARILIVCEGSKTEPNYLKELIDHYKLNSANIEVDGNSGSDPQSVFNYAKRRYREERKKHDAYDRVFCVFDKDQHLNYQQAKDKISTLKPNGVFKAITSIPCFEYFLLLHFKFTEKPYQGTGSKSACDCIIQDLSCYIQNYSKGDSELFAKTKDRLDDAIRNCKKAQAAAQATDTDNPSTLMHELIEYLRALEKE